MRGRLVDIIDPIHGFVRASPAEQAVIDAPAFQRLRRIRQLSGAHLVYPGAQHTRFEHSLGVMHVAGQAAQALREAGALGADEAASVRLAGLLHDIGHGPFSHLFEEVVRGASGAPHEDVGRRIVTGTEVADALSAAGHSPRKIAGLAFGGAGPRYVGEVISGAMSADIMDYLLRDGYYTGAEHAKVDHRRVVQSMGVSRGRLALERSALYSFESMMHSRYQMFKAVYFHKTVRSAEVMLLESMRLADAELGLTSQDLGGYLQMTDEAVLSRLLSLEPASPGLRAARSLARDYQDRRLYKCVYERMVPARSRLGLATAGAARAEIADRAGAAEGQVFVDSSATPSIPLSPSKEESRSIVVLGGAGRRRAGRELPIADLPLVSAMSSYMNIVRVYAAPRARKKVEIAARAVLGGPGR